MKLYRSSSSPRKKIIAQYNLLALVSDGYVYIEIRKGIPVQCAQVVQIYHVIDTNVPQLYV